MEKAIQFLRDILGAIYSAAGLVLAIFIIAWLVDSRSTIDHAAPAQVKEAPAPATSSVPSPEMERGFQVMEAATIQLRRCIRSSVQPAYAGGIYGRVQFLAFVKPRCYPAFNASFETTALGDVELLNATYNVIIEQEIAAFKN